MAAPRKIEIERGLGELGIGRMQVMLPRHSMMRVQSKSSGIFTMTGTRDVLQYSSEV
jgi:hypothetical protein